MTPERWARIKELFAEATAREPSQRATWLTETCGNDAALRAEVDKLLAAHERTDAVFDKPAAAYVTGENLVAGTRQWLGQRLGPWEIHAILGRGGMGEVYRARRVDAEYDKEAAIKLVPAGYQAEFVLKRLRTERQILATLEHPNIARLIDGGASEQGVPYLVMELVDGVPIDEYCRDKPLDTALRLFRDVCSAVTYAHQRLVVHRDLKPSNILVTPEGAVKLLDFGIAKLLQPSVADTGAPEATRFQSFTPGFASPEQVLGQPITTASDVYSLGVLLYLLLTGRSPYRRIESTQDAIREVCEAEPAAPSSVVARIAPDLDAICLRALRKEPDRRYRTVEELSEDIRRHLAGLPVIARGDRFSYRAGKFLRRHRIEVSAAALILITLIGGVVVSLREAHAARVERERAERHFQSVRTLADTFMFEVHDAIAPLQGSTEARELLVSTGLQYLNTLAQEAGDDAALKLDLARAYLKVADLQGQAYAANTGKQKLALETYRKAEQMAQDILKAQKENLDARRVLASSSLQQSRLLLMFGEAAEAQRTARNSVTLNEYVVARDDSVAARRALAGAYKAAAIVLDYNGEEATAADFSQKGVRILEDLHARQPDDRAIAAELGSAYGGAGAVTMTKQRDDALLDKAIEWHRKALSIDQKLSSTAPNDASVARLLWADYGNLSNLLNVRGDHAEALAASAGALEQLERMRSDTRNEQLHYDQLQLDFHRAKALLGVGDLDAVERLTHQSLDQIARMPDRDDNLHLVYLGASMQTLLANATVARAGTKGASREVAMRGWTQARDLYRGAIPRFEKVMGAVSLDYVDMIIVEQARAGLARADAALASH